jgi:hypothetical protein
VAVALRPSNVSRSKTMFALDTFAGVSTRTRPVKREFTNDVFRAPLVYRPSIVKPSNRRLLTPAPRFGEIVAVAPLCATSVTTDAFDPPPNEP